MSEVTMTFFLLIVLFALLGSGIWVAFSLMSVGMVGMMLFTEAPMGDVLATTVWGASNSWSLAAPWQFSHCTPARRGTAVSS